ncbi:phosphopantetheine-binding protein, partial [Klebsiella pneumoniae]|uniref:phosphopantetheine-binding protein n=1 Tax=Klebsiella pneumoniae TaxID=573 RepID=UPI001E5AD0A9
SSNALDDARGTFYSTGQLAKYDTSGYIAIVDVVPSVNENTKSSSDAKPKLSATSQRQRKLRSLWSRALNVPEQDIGLDDNFFLLGGDSISAMKLASEARPAGIRLTVAQMFSHKTLHDMAAVMEEAQLQVTAGNNKGETVVVPFSL